MIRLDFRVPIVLTEPVPAEKSPCCGSGVYLKEHGRRGLDDIRIGEVRVTRYICKACGRSFTVRPAGVTRSSKSARVRAASVALYVLGLSYGAVAIAFAVFRVSLSKTSVYNYVQAAGRKAMRLNRLARTGRIRFVGADTTGWKIKGKSCTASWVIDVLSGKTIAVEFLDKEDADTFARCIEKAVGTDFDLLVTDDAAAYAAAARKMRKPHQLCQTHFKKALHQRAKRILRELPKTDPHAKRTRKDCLQLQKAVRRGKKPTMFLLHQAKELFHRYLPARPPAPGQRASHNYRMRLLATELMENGLGLFQYRSYKDADGRYLLDGTNNATERAIGLTAKIRYRIMRGGKSKRAAKRLINLQAHIRNVQLDGATSFDMGTLIQ